MMRKGCLYILLVLGLLSGLAHSAKTVYRYLTPETALEYVNYHKQFNFVNFGIVDLRDKDDFAEGHIEHSVNIDYEAKDPQAVLEKLDHRKAYLLYNRNGRSGNEVLRLMEELHFREVYFLTGGFAAWQKKGQPQVKD